MNYLYITLGIILIFSIERLFTMLATRSEGGRSWLRQHYLFHPNIISVIRIPMGALSVALWMSGWPVFAIFWFAFWMITDITDGTIARHCNLETETGKWLDPLSDKLLYFPVLLFFALDGPLAISWVLLLIIIDTFGQASRLIVKKKAANVFGKSKTALLTLLLIITAFRQLAPDIQTNNIFTADMFPEFLSYLTVSCFLLAFLSAYCKIIPDTWYANSLSLANFACGLTAISYILHKEPVTAFVFVFIGQFFDLFDGRLARKFGSTRHGPIFDDLADGTSFGLALGFIIHFQFQETIPALAAAILYFLAVVFRLIRFSLHQKKLEPGIFKGLPSPAGALLAASAALLFPEFPHFGIAIVLLAAFLMVSRIRYWHFAQKMWVESPNIFKVAVCLIVLLFVSRTLADHDYRFTFKIAAFTLACLYCLLGNEIVASKLQKKQ